MRMTRYSKSERVEGVAGVGGSGPLRVWKGPWMSPEGTGELWEGQGQKEGPCEDPGTGTGGDLEAGGRRQREQIGPVLRSGQWEPRGKAVTEIQGAEQEGMGREEGRRPTASG